MIALFDGSTDVTQYLEYGTYNEDESLNNRRNTSTLIVNQNKINYGESVYVYDCFELREQASSGQAVLKVVDTFPECDKFRNGDVIRVRIKTAGEKKYTISSIDHTQRTVTLTSNLTATVAKTELCGKLRFAGTCTKSSETEIGHSATFGYKISLSDWSNAFDRKAVADTYADQWSREITGRIVYGYCANDTEVTLEQFESAWTQSGVALAMANDTVDRIQGTNAQKTGTSGAGTATWSKTISSADISSYTHTRWWWKIKETYGPYITAMKLRMGTNSSNYFEWNVANIGTYFEDCWNYESVILNAPDSTTGSPTLSAVTYLAFVLTSAQAIPTGNIIFDHMLASTGGFTLQNVQRGITKFSDYRSNYKKPTVVIEDIMKSQVMLWYIDVDRDIHEFSSSTTQSPFSIDDTSENYSKLVIAPDISKLVNRQMVRGGEAPDQSLFTQEKVADGVEKNFRLAYKPKTLSVYVANWNGSSYDAYVQKTVGVENLIDETTVDFVYSFNEKNVRNATFATLDALDKIKLTYYPYKPIRKRVQDPVSIAAMKAIVGGDGIFDGMPIVDPNIRTFEDAQLRGQAELDIYSNPLFTATFTTEFEGLHPGQYIRITDSDRGIDQDFLIQQVRATAKSSNRFTYSITAGTSLYGIIEMLQYLLKKSTDISVETNELVDIVINQDETINIDDDYTFTHKSKTVTAASRYVKNWDFIAETGSASTTGLIGTMANFTNFYMEIFSQTGSADFFTSGYNKGKSLRMIANTGGGAKDLFVRNIYKFPAVPNTQYTARVWLNIPTTLTNTTGLGSGAVMRVNEFQNFNDDLFGVVASMDVIDGQINAQEWVMYEATWTTNANCNYMGLLFDLTEAAGTIEFADVHLEISTAETQPNPAIASFCEVT